MTPKQVAARLSTALAILDKSGVTLKQGPPPVQPRDRRPAGCTCSASGFPRVQHSVHCIHSH